MALPANIAALSQTPSLNGPDGASDPPSILDDGLRLAYSFIAQLRDGVGYTAGAVVAGLGYTPVQQGTGPSQTADTVKIGWSAGGVLRLAVNSTDYGASWPINVTGSAGSVGGVTSPVADPNGAGGLKTMRWDGASILFGVGGNEYGGIAPINVQWTRVVSRPTALSQFTNDLGFLTSSNAIVKIGNVSGIGNSGSTALTANIDGFGAVAWGVTPSDRRLKRDITDSTEDALAKVSNIRFVRFRFNEGIDDGREHEGAVAQELKAIDPNWVNEAGTYMAPNNDALLMAALKSISQLQREVVSLKAALEAR